MDLPANYQEKFRQPAAEKSGQPRSERDELLDAFLSRLNPDRLKDGYQPYTHAHLAKKLKAAGYTDADYYGLFNSCERARSFGRLFAHLTKPKV